MKSYTIAKSGLTNRLEPQDAEWAWAVDNLYPDFH
jgi:hypothetical protein